jgi:hypothetical protein
MMVRRGMGVIELVVAGTLLGTLLVICLQLLTVTAAQRRIAEQRQLAVIELGNVMERLTVRPWGELTSKAGAAVKLSPSVAARLPGADLSIEVTASPADTDVKRIVVSLRWKDRSGQFVSPVKITTWRWKERQR